MIGKVERKSCLLADAASAPVDNVKASGRARAEPSRAEPREIERGRGRNS